MAETFAIDIVSGKENTAGNVTYRSGIDDVTTAHESSVNKPSKLDSTHPINRP